MRSNLKKIVLEKEVEIGDRIQNSDIAKATGLDENTISRWMSPKPIKRIDTAILVRLCEWAGVGIGDMLVFEKLNQAN